MPKSQLHGQLPLSMPYVPVYDFASYFQAPAGLLQWLQQLGKAQDNNAQPLPHGFLHGEKGSGKTHLLLATCAHARAHGRSVAYLPLAQLHGRIVQALQSTTAQLLAVDDVHCIAADAEAEQALFDAHNRQQQTGGQMLYAACAIPDALQLQLPDLRSRLNQCMRAALQPLDDAGLALLLQHHAQARKMAIEPAAVQWLLQRVERNAGHLMALLNQLDYASLAAQRRITVPFLRQILQSSEQSAS